MFLERKIHEKLHGTANRHFHALQGLESLKETVVGTRVVLFFYKNISE